MRVRRNFNNDSDFYGFWFNMKRKKMDIKEHFNKMVVAVGWSATGCAMLYGVVFTMSKIWEVMWLCVSN